MSNMYQDILNATDFQEKSITFFGKSIGRKKLIYYIDNMAEFLSKLGVKDGDVIGIVSPNIPTSVIAFYAINKLGAISNIFHPLTSAVPLIDKLKESGAKYVFVYDLFFTKYKKLLAENQITPIICSAKDYLDKALKKLFAIYLNTKRGSAYNAYTEKEFTSEFPNMERECGNDIACYLHSAGTEKEKTVVLTNRNFIELKEKMIGVIGRENIAGEKTLASLPMFHCFGLGIGVHASLALGFNISLLPVFNAEKALKAIRKQKLTIMIVIPSMLRKIMEVKEFGKYLVSVKHIYCGGDRLSEKLRLDFERELNKYNPIKILEGYGLTEMTGVCVVNTESEYRAGSIGKPLLGVDAKVLDDNGNESECGITGELALSSSTLMRGYSDGSESYAVFGNRKYFKTGDMACMDSDGFIYYKERKKNVIKISGVNVFPKDIEDLVLTVGGIAECVAIEYRKGDKPFIGLFVIAEGEKEKIKNEIYKVIKANTMKYCLPEKIKFIKKLPLTKNGKIDKQALKAIIQK